jgi:poly(3-hydroxybutyrate) depolymerase
MSATAALARTAELARARDGCTTAATTATVQTASIVTYTHCSAATIVQTVSYAGLAHEWPYANVVGGDASAATLIWAFFSRLAAAN